MEPSDALTVHVELISRTLQVLKLSELHQDRTALTHAINFITASGFYRPHPLVPVLTSLQVKSAA